jgi:predicted ArsR family transcriptional regulator
LSTLQIQARALGDPTRHKIFEYISDSGDAVGVAELTELLGLHHNAIRQHLAKLVDADLVVEVAPVVAGRGRPRLQYMVAPSAESRWGAIGPYERLAVLLTEVVRSGESPVDVGRRVGLRQRLGGAVDDADPVASLVEEMESQGFAPAVREHGRAVDVTLQVCPFESAVLADPDTICQLHLGLAQGLAEAIGGVEVLELVPKDPRRAHCRLRCELTAAAPG